MSDNALTKEQIFEIARKSGNGVPAGLVYAIIMEESGGQLDAKSDEDAQGLMQVLKRFHPDVDLWDPVENVKVGTSIFRSCMFSLNHIRARWKRPSQITFHEESWLKRGLHGYVMGVGNVEWYDLNPDKYLPPEVVRYAVNVLSIWHEKGRLP